MDRNQKCLGRPGSSGSGVIGKLCAFVVIAGWGGAGCHDPRISLAEFLQSQQAMRAAAVERVEQGVAPQTGQLVKPFTVGSSDVLMVTVTGTDQTELFPPIKVRIDRDGEIELPILGAIRVAEMQLEDVEDTIHDAYVPAVIKNAVVHVEPVDVDTVDVLLIGAVPVPGLVPLRRNERNMLFAIVGAGGVAQLASGRATLRRVRRPTEEVTLDLTDPTQLRAALTLEPLEAGDIIDVHAAQPNTTFVGGLVNVAAPQTYPPGTQMTVLQALAAAGGLRTDVSPKEGTLIRRMPNGQDVHVKLDLKRIGNGRDPNILLAAGDILWVPETIETRIQGWINRNIFLRAGVSVNYNVTGVEYLNRRALQSRLGGGGLEDSFDPFGFLSRGAALQTLVP